MLSSFYYRIYPYFYDIWFTIVNCFYSLIEKFGDIHPRWYLATIIFILLTLFFTIKIKFPFWNLQPVYHSYDFWRKWSSSPFIIQKTYPFQNKFCDFKNIKTRDFLEMDTNTLKSIVDLLISHYIPSDQVLFTLTEKHLHDNFVGQNHISYISIYYEKRYTNENISNNALELPYINNPIGIITSRSISIFVLPKKTNNNSYIKYPCYYWDYLCVHRDHKHRNISRQLIQTHEYNERFRNPGILISMFKKEGDLSLGIVPLVVYYSYTFQIPIIKPRKFPKHCILTRINKTSFGDLNDFLLQYLKSPGKTFPFAAVSDIGALNKLIMSDNMYVFMLRKRENVLALYFFKDAKVQYEHTNGVAIQFIGSICNISNSELFYLGFIQSLYKISWKTHYKVILFESIGHNTIIWNILREKVIDLLEQKNAYYLYNFIVPNMPFHAKDILVLL